MTTVTVTITEVAPDPFGRDDLNPWRVIADVLDIHEGGPLGPTLELLIHSPTKAFRDAEPVGKTFTITLPDGAEPPFVGRFTLVRDRPGQPG